MSLPMVTPTRNQSSAFSFELLKVLVALSRTEFIIFLKLGFTLRKDEQPIRGMELWEKEAQKD